MSVSSRPAAPGPRAAAVPAPASPAPPCLAAWVIPGAGHLMLGQFRKASIFFVVLIGMFAIGIYLGGRLFPFQFSEPLVFLAAAGEWALGLPRIVAMLAGAGQGEVVWATYEYGNTFL